MELTATLSLPDTHALAILGLVLGSTPASAQM